MKNKVLLILLGFLSGIVNGLFGSGGGIITVIALNKVLKLEQDNSQATSIAIILPLCLVSIFFYRHNINLSLINILWIAIGGVVGSYFGANILKKISNKWLHIIFAIFMIIAGVKLCR